MATTITETEMASDQTPHTAVLIDGGWAVSWLPNRVLTRNQAVTAMTAAEEIWSWVHDSPAGPFRADEEMWLFVGGWAAELGISGPRAMVLASMSPAEIIILNEHRKIT
jgi:hypothetical protein